MLREVVQMHEVHSLLLAYEVRSTKSRYAHRINRDQS